MVSLQDDKKVAVIGITTETARDTKKLLRFSILSVIAAVAVASRLFSVVNFESIIHEFDPWCVDTLCRADIQVQLQSFEALRERRSVRVYELVR